MKNLKNKSFIEEISEIIKKRIIERYKDVISVKVEDVKGKYKIEKIIKIIPLNEKSSNVYIHVIDDIEAIDLFFGECTTLELDFSGRRYLNVAFPEELIKLCDFIIQGNLKEELWYKDNKIVKCISEIKTENKPIKIKYFSGFFNPLCRFTKKIIVYSPYI